MNKRQKLIIAPVDFTRSAEVVMKHAKVYAKLHDAEIILVHAIEPVSVLAQLGAEDNIIERKMDFAHKLLQKLMDKYHEDGIRMSRMVKEGKPYKIISDISEEMKAEMIVMGTWGSDARESGMMGSNTNKVIRNAYCPVVSVSMDPEGTGMSNILVAVDPEFGIRELRAFLEEYKSVYNPHVDLLCVVKDSSENDKVKDYLNKQKETLAKQGLDNVDCHVRVGAMISEAILEFAKEQKHDMIWMETHGRSGMTAWMMGSVTEDVIQYSGVPVLSLHPERAGNLRYITNNVPV